MKLARRRKWISLLVLLLSFGCSTPSRQITPEDLVFRPFKGYKTIAIVGLNDFHGSFAPRMRRSIEVRTQESIEYEQGGLAILSHQFQTLKMAFGKRLLILDAGDEWQGSIDSNLDEGASAVSFFNSLGVQAAAVGNHEFDFGTEGPDRHTPNEDPRGVLKKRFTEARYPYLSANIIERATQRPPNWPNFKPSALFNVDGVKIGVVGLSTEETSTTTVHDFVKDLDFSNSAKRAAQEAKALRQQGAQAVLLVMHAGTRCASGEAPTERLDYWAIRDHQTPQKNCDSDSEVARVLRAIPKGFVDAVVAGHSHQIVHHWIEGVPVIEGGAFNTYFNVLYLPFDLEDGELAHERIRIEGPVPVCEKVFANQRNCDGQSPAPVEGRGPLISYEFHGRTVRADENIQERLQILFQRNEKIKKQFVGEAARPIRHNKNGESEFGNWIADILREKAKTDFAVINAEGIRADLEAGPITFEDIYRALPFDNTISKVQMTGRELRQMIRIATSGVHYVANVSGLQITLAASTGSRRSGTDIDKNGRIDAWEIDRVLSLTDSNGHKIEDNRFYTVATYDYLVRGGDHQSHVFDKIPASRKVFNAAGPTRDTVIYYLKDAGKINGEERPLIDPAKPRIIFRSAK